MTCKCGTKAEKVGGRYRYRVSTESRDCENERILISAWDRLGKFPLYVEHSYGEKVGEANVFIREGELIADVEVTDEATKARVESGELRMASVGFDRLEKTTTEDGQSIVTKARLKEVSLVAAGCNFDACRLKAMKQPPAEETKEEMTEPTMPAPTSAGAVSATKPPEFELFPAMMQAAVSAAVSAMKKQIAALTEERDGLKAELERATEALASTTRIDDEDEGAEGGEEIETEPAPEDEPAELDFEDIEQIKNAVGAALKTLTVSAVNYHSGRLS